LEILELLEKYGFSGNSPVIRGSAKKALEGDSYYLDIIIQLMDKVDE